MDGWDTDGTTDMVVGRRRGRGGRRRRRRIVLWPLVTLVLLGLVAGALYWVRRPSGLASLSSPAIVAPGGFRASLGEANTITVGLEVHNTAPMPVTLTKARLVAPKGVSIVTIAFIPPGEDNAGFTLEGPLPAMSPIELGTEGDASYAILAARFTVDCDQLRSDGATGEQIFVTVRVDAQEREEELTPPVVGESQWLAATATRTCTDPVQTSSPEPPLPPLPSGSAG